jgi:hypothetical protein
MAVVMAVGVLVPERAATAAAPRSAPAPLVEARREAPAEASSGPTCDGDLAFRLTIAAIATAP